MTGNRVAVNVHLRLFKTQGQVNYVRTLSIPSAERITAICKGEEGYKQVCTVLVVYIAKTFGNMNLRKGMNEDQIINLAEKIIETAEEDNLSLEDVMLFLGELEEGKRGKIFDRMDMPTFLEMFEGYREERHQAYRMKQHEADANYKASGNPERSSEQFISEDDSYRRVMGEYNIKQEILKQSKPNE